MHESKQVLPYSTPDKNVPYEAPAVESVLTSEELEREVAYAGSNNVSCAPVKY